MPIIIIMWFKKLMFLESLWHWLLASTCLDATLDGNGMISIIRNAGEWTCSAVGYKSLTSIASVAKSTIGIDSSREAKTAQY